MVYKLPEWHYHSITCHVPCVTVPLTALSYAIFLKTGDSFWHGAHLALAAVSFLAIIPVICTGFLERETRYTNWNPLFRAKLLLAVLLFAGLAYQGVTALLMGIAPESYGGFYAAVTLGIQTVLIGGQIILGLITAQGRIGGRVSYHDDPEYKLSYDIIKEVKQAQPKTIIEEFPND